jgi:hypothetical protein
MNTRRKYFMKKFEKSWKIKPIEEKLCSITYRLQNLIFIKELILINSLVILIISEFGALTETISAYVLTFLRPYMEYLPILCERQFRLYKKS